MGKREIRKALGTSDPREALKRVRKASVEADAVFETYRVRTAPNASDRVPASEADLERLALQAFQASERQNLTTFLQTSEGDFEEILSGLRDDESVYCGGLSPVTFEHRFAAVYALQWCSVHTGCLNAVVSIGSFRKRLPVAAKIALVTAGTMAEVPGSPIPPGGSKLWTMWTSMAGASFMRSIW